MQRYDTYKDSGVKWLGEIPSHWEVCRFKNLVSLVTTPSNDSNKIGLENIESGSGKFIQTENEFEGNGVHFQVNDVVYGKLRPYLQKVWLATFSGNAVGDFFIFRVNNKVVGKYLQYLMLSRCFTDDVNASTYGAKMPRVSSEYILTMRCAVPSIDEQIKMVSYLDTATAKIDAAIAQQQKMIDLLNERKQIIINRTVTRGLNPNVKMKDSGVEWIGEVPEGWDTCALKKKAKVIIGKMLSNNPTNKYKYICAKDVHYGEIDTSDLKEMSFTHEERQLYEVKKGDMLIVEGGAGAGGCAIVKEDLKNIYIQNSIMIVRGTENLLNDYLCFFMQSINQKGYIEYICNKATIPHFTKEKVGAVIIPLPPFKKQVEIVDYLNTAIAPIDDAIKNCQNQISLLQERKQIIINEVVTGKIKVV